MVFDMCISAPARAIMEITVDDTGYLIDGSKDVEVPGKFKYQTIGTDKWKFWAYKTLDLKFDYIKGSCSACVVGRGANGGRSSTGDGNHYGGGGGKGGKVESANVTFTNGSVYHIKIDETGTSITGNGVNQSVEVGGGANGGSGGVHRYSTGAYSGPGNGSDGSYAFGDSTFDGVKYGPGGGGGSCEWSGYGTGKRGASTDIGAGGHGGHNHDGTSTNGAAGNNGAAMLWSETI